MPAHVWLWWPITFNGLRTTALSWTSIKGSVVGVSYKIVTVAGEAGDASPSTPIGVNLPNANWIRVEHGSKSVSLGNIEDAYHASAGKGMAEEFGFSTMHNERAEKYGELGSKMHTALHEVVGHVGKINPEWVHQKKL